MQRYDVFDAITGALVTTLHSETAAAAMADRLTRTSGRQHDYDVSTAPAATGSCRCRNAVCCTCGDW